MSLTVDQQQMTMYQKAFETAQSTICGLRLDISDYKKGEEILRKENMFLRQWICKSLGVTESDIDEALGKQ